MRGLLAKISVDERTEASILPAGDGIVIASKR